MLFFQAVLISLLCYLGALGTPWLMGLTGGWYTISRPLSIRFFNWTYFRRCHSGNYYWSRYSGSVYCNGYSWRSDAG